MNHDTNSHVRQAVDAWNQTVEQQVAVMKDVAGIVTKLQSEGTQQTHSLMDELAKLSKASLHYAGNLASSQSAVQSWKAQVREQFARFGWTTDWLPATETDSVTQANDMIDRLTELSKTCLTCVTSLSEQWRKVAMEAVERSADVLHTAK